MLPSRAGDAGIREATRIYLPAFFLLTFAFTWAMWLASSARAATGTSWLFGFGRPVFLLGVFAPALVALALTAYVEGREGVVRLLAPIGKWDVGLRWYLFAVAYMAAAELLAALVHRVVAGAWPTFGTRQWLLMLGAIPISTWVQAGEELGWRGYALPRLARLLGLGTASVLLGAIWALWHLPLFFMPGSGSDGQSFPIYLLFVTAVSVAMAWLYWRTGGSLLLVMLMHASVNNTTGIVPVELPNAVNPLSLSGSFVAWATVAVLWAVATLLLPQMWRADLETRNKPNGAP